MIEILNFAVSDEIKKSQQATRTARNRVEVRCVELIKFAPLRSQFADSIVHFPEANYRPLREVSR